MKKLLAFVAVFLFICWKNQPPKLLKVQADLPTWTAILNVIDLSDAPPKERVAARDFIIRQLQDTTINKK